MVEQFGPMALGANPDIFDLVRISKILSVRDMYRVAGTHNQKDLTTTQWELIVELDALAAERDAEQANEKDE